MEEIYACRICISTYLKLYDIRKNDINLLLKEVVQIESAAEDGLPQYICNICIAFMNKYKDFKNKCMYSQLELKDLADKNMLTTNYLRQLDKDAPLFRILSVQKLTKITQIVYKDQDVKQEIVQSEDDVDYIKEKEFKDDEDNKLNSKKSFTAVDFGYDDDEYELEEEESNEMRQMTDEYLRNEYQDSLAKMTTRYAYRLKKDNFMVDNQPNTGLKSNKAAASAEKTGSKRKISTKSRIKRNKSNNSKDSRKSKTPKQKNVIEDEEDFEYDDEYELEEEERNEMRHMANEYLRNEYQNSSADMTTCNAFSFKKDNYMVDNNSNTSSSEKVSNTSKNANCIKEEKNLVDDQTNTELKSNIASTEKTCSKRKISSKSRVKRIETNNSKDKRKNKTTKQKNVIEDKEDFAQMLAEKNVEVKQLTKKEQIEEVHARKLTVNYIGSMYKCDKCYKGFWKETTYKNHMIKHDPKSGAFVCDICQMRYVSKAKLYVHTHTRHSDRYSCTLCDYVSFNWEQAKQHHNYHQGVLFKCEKCSKEFKRPSTYYSHLRIHHPTTHVCNICGKSFISTNGLKFHHQQSHRDEELTNYCKDCDLYFKSDAAFATHIATASTHNKDGANRCHYCNDCGESFQSDPELKTHQQEHKKNETGEKVTCEKCKKVFKNSQMYTFHYQRYHSGAIGSATLQPVVCEICGMKLLTKMTYIRHKRMHTGEKPFPCQHCPKTFRTSTHLKSHERTHTGERPYKCPTCSKAFREQGALARHSLVHSGIKPYPCTHCGKSFSQWSSQKVHINTVHFKLPAPPRKKKKAQE